MPKDRAVKISLSVLFFKEGNKVIAHAPFLDLCTYGHSLDQARKRFNEALQIFLEETQAKGTLETIFLENGWSHVKGDGWKAPLPIAQIQEEVNVHLRAA